jgi:poly(3-hydroxybutyrate) depolymerase
MLRLPQALLLTTLLSSSPLLAVADELPKLLADPAKTSVSGLSSGAFMAVQYAVAFSGSTYGIGVVAGGPYNCALVNVGGIVTCMQGDPLGSNSYDAAKGFAVLGQIDPVENIAKEKVYLFSGTADNVVLQTVMDSVRDFFTDANVPAANLVYVNNFPAGHSFVSPDFGNLCQTNAAPYINECQAANGLYDQPEAILTQIYGPLKPKAASLSSKPAAFDQTQFASAEAKMADTGYIYVPASCQQTGGQSCAVHVVFHGCEQGATVKGIGDDVYSKVGYNQWADTNSIIVLYPQISPTSAVGGNPEGCWDWFGYTGLNFQVQSGQQLTAIRKMVQHLTAQ